MQPTQFYEFGPFRVDVAERLLLRNGEPLSLPPKVFETLLALVENSGHLLEKEDLMQRLWPDTFVEEANLANNISLLRRVLNSEGRQYIETVPKRGYRFIAGVKESSEETDKTYDVDEPRVITSARQWGRLTIPIVLACLVLIVLAYYVFTRRAQPSVAESPSVKSIAVLPFKPLVEGNRDEVLELGVADTLITRLSNIRQITVRPIGAVRRYVDPANDALAAGREQQVDAVLDGNIQKAGDKIRVTVRLTRVADEVTLWAAQFDEQYTDILAVQDAISKRVAEVLIVKLTGEEKQALAKHYTENIEAYQLYLKGRYFWSKFTEEGLKKSIEYYNQALERDPNYALAYIGLAASYVVLGVNYLPPKEVMPKAKAYVSKALELDKTLADAYCAQCGVKFFFDWDWAGAEIEFKHTIELGPADEAITRELYGYCLWATGRLDEALIQMKRAQELDPLSLVINEDLGVTYYYAHKYEQAIEQQKKNLDLDPNYFFAHVRMGQAYEQKGMYKEAIDELTRARIISGNWPGAVAELGCAYALQGGKNQARSALNELKSRGTKEYIDPYLIALVHTCLDEKDQAFASLEKAFEARSPWMAWLKVEPKFDRLRSDPRFRDLLGRVGLPQ